MDEMDKEELLLSKTLRRTEGFSTDIEKICTISPFSLHVSKDARR